MWYFTWKLSGSPKRAEQPNDYFTPMLQFNTNMAARLQGAIGMFTLLGWSISTKAKEDDVWKTIQVKTRNAGWVKRLGELQLDCFETLWVKKLFNSQTMNIYGEYDELVKNPLIASLVKKGYRRYYQYGRRNTNKRFYTKMWREVY